MPTPELPRADETNPWVRLSGSIKYRNRWMTLREDQVLRPDGQRGIYGVVEAAAATGVVALTPEQEVVLVGQYRYSTGRYSWEIVEGGAEPGETPLAAVQRELLEEAGLEAARWTPIPGEFQMSNCFTAELGYLFVAQDLRQVAQPTPEGTEQLTLARIPLRDALALIDRGVISDAVSVIGLLRAARMLAAGELQAGDARSE
ncbi:MAG: NUDIX domain-containing protein [Planctomycetes bacterium]|nr:NUDIX domain-containing protein [Planctomycetota bacterium]